MIKQLWREYKLLRTQAKHIKKMINETKEFMFLSDMNNIDNVVEVFDRIEDIKEFTANWEK